ncbi:MAG: hypothetical protein H6512_01095 [Acidimicrobiia bacterium]|nr:hypothetical protein [Acidimicrobiia bacterium]
MLKPTGTPRNARRLHLRRHLTSMAAVFTLTCLAFPAVASARIVDGAVIGQVPASGYSCHPLANPTCALPWPTNLATQHDASSPTGLRTHVAPEVMSAQGRATISQPLQPHEVLNNGSTGFSAAGPILFELPADTDMRSLTDSSVVVFDTATSTTAPVRVRAETHATERDAKVISVWPKDRFEFGHRYVAALTNSPTTKSGAPIAAAPGLASLLSEGNNDPGAAYIRGLVAEANGFGVPTQRIASITDFTVRSRSDIADPIRAVTAQIWDTPHPIRNVHVVPGGDMFGATVVEGEVLVSDYRTGPESMVDTSQAPRDNWLKFGLAIPNNAAGRPAAVSIYGPGLSLPQGQAFIQVGENAKHNIATLAIDFPNHGSRADEDGGWLLGITNPGDAPKVVSLMYQSIFDQLSLLRAIETSMAGLDIVGAGGRPDGVPDLDPNKVIYQAVSMGSVLGSAFVAVAPDLRGATLEVGGVGVMNILSQSNLYSWFEISGVFSSELSGPETAFQAAVMQHEVDLSDGINLVDWIASPPEGLPGKAVLLNYALDGGTVSNQTSETFARLTRSTQIGTVRRFIPGVPVGDRSSGRWVHQLPDVIPSFLDNLRYEGFGVGGALGHLSFLALPGSQRNRVAWYAQILGR